MIFAYYGQKGKKKKRLKQPRRGRKYRVNKNEIQKKKWGDIRERESWKDGEETHTHTGGEFVKGKSSGC